MIHQIDGKYRVMYKHPSQYTDRQANAFQGMIYTFEGVCENFSTGLSAFRNDKNELLLINYHDIIQLKPIRE
jgi:hypothetical protein